jgi:dipeptidyl aminopeptidase/acylaminoacyl peptidase
MAKEYGADKVAVIGGSYGGFLAMQLLTRINRNNAEAVQAHVEMPKLLVPCNI